MSDESRNVLSVQTKDELVNRLRTTIDQLTDFIRISEDVCRTHEMSPQMQEFLDLLNQLKDVPAKLGQAPVIIQETVDFVECIIGEVHDIRMQLEHSFSHESVLKSAVDVLDQIPDSTMKATDQILNTIDSITARESEASELFNRIMGNPDGINEESMTLLARIRELFTENQNDHFTIMDALQFQDITTQQIQHVNHLLETTELKLSELALKLKGLDDEDIQNILEFNGKKKRVYDPKAEYKARVEEQSFADSLYDNKNQLSQDDIESLISNFGK
ncbi:MAG: hypothetical protein KBA26_02830 [Candidatus Delongbacteria bacterium]|nr:hypothetical protein [Candidatus Delongbacteria bacterium]